MEIFLTYVHPQEKQERCDNMTKLLTYLRKHRIQTILAPLFKMLEAVFELIVPLVVARMIDSGVANHDVPYLIREGILLVLLRVIGFLAAVTAQ
jgi:ABC-type multidrug transport system fused ATPase/permease subunit